MAASASFIMGGSYSFGGFLLRVLVVVLAFYGTCWFAVGRHVVALDRDRIGFWQQIGPLVIGAKILDRAKLSSVKNVEWTRRRGGKLRKYYFLEVDYDGRIYRLLKGVDRTDLQSLVDGPLRSLRRE